MGDDLIHYGVKGQRWGVRNKRSSGATSKKIKKSADQLKYEKLLGKDPRSLTTNELSFILNRENKLTQTYQKRTTKTKSGEKFIKRAIEIGALANSVYALYRSPVVKKGLTFVNNTTKPV